MIRGIVFFLLLIISTEVFSQSRFGPEIPDSILYSVTSISGTLYAGIENMLMLKSSNSDSLTLETNNGVIFYDDLFIIIPARTGQARIELYSINNQEKELIGHQNMDVTTIPEPFLKIGSVVIVENKILPMDIFMRSDSISVFLTLVYYKGIYSRL